MYLYHRRTTTPFFGVVLTGGVSETFLILGVNTKIANEFPDGIEIPFRVPDKGEG